jgi:ABC-type branched-subunit amino acid transport system ATPase component
MDPELILLDEVMAGSNVTELHMIMDLIRKLTPRERRSCSSSTS